MSGVTAPDDVGAATSSWLWSGSSSDPLPIRSTYSSAATAPVDIVLIVPTMTAPMNERASAALAMSRAFAAARRATVALGEDVESNLAAELERIVRQFGEAAIALTSHAVFVEGIDPAFALLALRAVGHLPGGAIKEGRRTLAEQAVRSGIPEIRFGGLHVLAALADERAIEQIRSTARRETVGAIRADAERLAAWLARRHSQSGVGS